MAAQPIEHDDPLDPVRILADLPEREHAGFLAAYREAADTAARDPEGWAALARVLRAWRHIAVAASRPGFYEEQAAVRAGTADGMLLEDYLAQRASGELPALAVGACAAGHARVPRRGARRFNCVDGPGL
jgi:hypothetical protein